MLDFLLITVIREALLSLEGRPCCQGVLLHYVHDTNILLLVKDHANVVHSMEFIRNRCLIVKDAVPIHIEQNLGSAALRSIVLYHYCVQLLLKVVLTEYIMTEALLGRPSDVRVELNQVFEDCLKSCRYPVQSVHEVVTRRGSFNVLDLF